MFALPAVMIMDHGSSVFFAVGYAACAFTAVVMLIIDVRGKRQ